MDELATMSDVATESGTRTRRRLKSLVCGVALAVVAATTASAQTIRDTEIEETLAVYTDPLLLAAGLSPSAVDTYIVNDKSLNAFVTRGQNIFLHTGLILAADTPNQLKGVIAHEAGHIADGRLARSDYENRSAYGAMLLAAGAGLAAILAGEGGAGAAILGGSTQFGAFEVLKHTRVGESVADQLAANYLEQTNQSGRGLIEFFEKFRYQEVMSAGRRNPYFRSHPLSSDRIEKLREVVSESAHSDAVDSDEDLQRMEMMKAKLLGFLYSPQRVFSEFPAEDQSQPARYARSVAYFLAGQLDLAVREIDSLIGEEPDNPYFYELKAQFLYESGRGEESIAPIREALRLKPDAPLFKLALAQALLERNQGVDAEDAEDVLKSVVQAEPGNATAWYWLGQAHAKQGEEPLAEYATAEQMFAVGQYRQAKAFAERARADMPPNTPAWRRASDIVAVAEVQLDKSERRRGPRPLVGRGFTVYEGKGR